MSDPSFWHPLLTVWVDQVDDCWKHMGVPTPMRLELRHNLVVDLGAARLAGATIDELTESPPEQFARELAGAAAVDIPAVTGQRARPEEGGVLAEATTDTRFEVRLVVSAVLGALVGGLASLVVVYPVGLGMADSYPHHQVLLALGTHIAAAVLAAACGAVWVGIAFRYDARRGQLVRVSALGLLVCGAVAVAPAVALAWTAGFENSLSTDASVAFVVLCVLIVGMWGVAHGVTHYNDAPSAKPTPSA